MSKVNTGRRTKAEDAAALDALVTENTAEGRKVIEENGATYIVETNAAGLQIKTRVA